MSDKKIWEYATDGDLEGVKKRVELKGKDIINTEKNEYGDSALNWASWYGHLPIVQYLISNGANINDKNIFGFTALHGACDPLSSDSDSIAIEIIKTLIANGANETIRTNDKCGSNSNKTPAEIAEKDTLRNALIQAVRDKVNGKLQPQETTAQELQELQAYVRNNSSSTISVEELLNCPQCQSPYTDPRLLPCEHTLCLTCVEKIQNSKELKDRVCPVDKTAFPVNLKPKDLPQNLLCSALGTLLPQSTSNTSKPTTCINCNEKPASLCCGVCGDLCEACSKTIHSMAAFKSHKPISLQEKKQATIPKCSTHIDNKIDLYCPQCKVLVCYVCVANSHSTHGCVLVSDAAKGPKDALKSNLVSFLRKKNILQKLIRVKREATKMDETKIAQLLAGIQKRNKEIDTHIQQFNQTNTFIKTLLKMIEDQSNFEILDQKVFDKTKSLVESLYKVLYKEEQPSDVDADETGVSPNDIDLVMQQAGVTRAHAVKALKANHNDIISAIMSLAL